MEKINFSVFCRIIIVNCWKWNLNSPLDFFFKLLTGLVMVCGLLSSAKSLKIHLTIEYKMHFQKTSNIATKTRKYCEWMRATLSMRHMSTEDKSLQIEFNDRNKRREKKTCQKHKNSKIIFWKLLSRCVDRWWWCRYWNTQKNLLFLSRLRLLWDFY